MTQPRDRTVSYTLQSKVEGNAALKATATELSRIQLVLGKIGQERAALQTMADTTRETRKLVESLRDVGRYSKYTLKVRADFTDFRQQLAAFKGAVNVKVSIANVTALTGLSRDYIAKFKLDPASITAVKTQLDALFAGRTIPLNTGVPSGTPGGSGSPAARTASAAAEATRELRTLNRELATGATAQNAYAQAVASLKGKIDAEIASLRQQSTLTREQTRQLQDLRAASATLADALTRQSRAANADAIAKVRTELQQARTAFDQASAAATNFTQRQAAFRTYEAEVRRLNTTLTTLGQTSQLTTRQLGQVANLQGQMARSVNSAQGGVNAAGLSGNVLNALRASAGALIPINGQLAASLGAVTAAFTATQTSAIAAGAATNTAATAAGFAAAGVAALGVAVLGAAAAFVSLAVTGIEQTKKIERAFVTLKNNGETNLNGVSKALDRLKESGNSAAETFSKGDLALALADTVKAGVSTADALNLMGTATKFAAQEGTNLAEQAGMLLKAIRQYNLETTDAARVGDMFAKAGNLAAGTATDLFMGFNKVASTGFQAKLEMNELLGMLVQLDNKGMSAADVGADALRTALSSLADVTKEGRGVLYDWNIALEDAGGKARPAGDIIKELGAKLAELGVTYNRNTGQLEGNGEALEAVSKIMDVRAAAAVLNLQEGWRSYSDEIQRSTGELDKNERNAAQTLERQQARLKANLEDLGQNISKSLVGPLADALTTLNKFLDRLQGGTPALNAWLKQAGLDGSNLTDDQRARLDGLVSRRQTVRDRIAFNEEILSNPAIGKTFLGDNYRKQTAELRAELKSLDEQLKGFAKTISSGGALTLPGELPPATLKTADELGQQILDAISGPLGDNEADNLAERCLRYVRLALGKAYPEIQKEIDALFSAPGADGITSADEVKNKLKSQGKLDTYKGLSDLKPGDVVFYDKNHAGIYIGDGYVRGNNLVTANGGPSTPRLPGTRAVGDVKLTSLGTPVGVFRAAQYAATQGVQPPAPKPNAAPAPSNGGGTPPPVQTLSQINAEAKRLFDTLKNAKPGTTEWIAAAEALDKFKKTSDRARLAVEGLQKKDQEARSGVKLTTEERNRQRIEYDKWKASLEKMDVSQLRHIVKIKETANAYQAWSDAKAVLDKKLAAQGPGEAAIEKRMAEARRVAELLEKAKSNPKLVGQAERDKAKLENDPAGKIALERAQKQLEAQKRLDAERDKREKERRAQEAEAAKYARDAQVARATEALRLARQTEAELEADRKAALAKAGEDQAARLAAEQSYNARIRAAALARAKAERAEAEQIARAKYKDDMDRAAELKGQAKKNAEQLARITRDNALRAAKDTYNTDVLAITRQGEERLNEVRTAAQKARAESDERAAKHQADAQVQRATQQVNAERAKTEALEREYKKALKNAGENAEQQLAVERQFAGRLRTQRQAEAQAQYQRDMDVARLEFEAAKREAEKITDARERAARMEAARQTRVTAEQQARQRRATAFADAELDRETTLGDALQTAREKRQAREEAAAERARDIERDAMEGRVEAAKRGLAELERLKQEEFERADGDKAELLRIEQTWGPRLLNAQIAVERANRDKLLAEAQETARQRKAQLAKDLGVTPEQLTKQQTASMDTALANRQASIRSTSAENEASLRAQQTSRERAANDAAEEEARQHEATLAQIEADATQARLNNAVSNAKTRQEEEGRLRDAALKAVKGNLERQLALEMEFARRGFLAATRTAEAELAATRASNSTKFKAARDKARQDFKGADLTRALDGITAQETEADAAAVAAYYAAIGQAAQLGAERVEQANDAINTSVRDLRGTLSSAADGLRDKAASGTLTRADLDAMSKTIDDVLKRAKDLGVDANTYFVAALSGAKTLIGTLRDDAAAMSRELERVRQVNADLAADVAQSGVTALNDAIAARQAARDADLADETLTAQQRLDIERQANGELLALGVAAITAQQQAEEAAESERYYRAVSNAEETGADLELLEQQHTANLNAIRARAQLAWQRVHDESYQRMTASEKAELDERARREEAAMQEEVQNTLDGLETMTGAQRQAAFDHLMAWRATYAAQGKAGLAAIAQIDEGLKRLQDTNKQTAKTWADMWKDLAGNDPAVTLRASLLRQTRREPNRADTVSDAMQPFADGVKAASDMLADLNKNFGALTKDQQDKERAQYEARRRQLLDLINLANRLALAEGRTAGVNFDTAQSQAKIETDWQVAGLKRERGEITRDDLVTAAQKRVNDWKAELAKLKEGDAEYATILGNVTRAEADLKAAREGVLEPTLALQAAQAALNRELGAMDAPYADTIKNLEELKTTFPDIAAEIDKLIAKYRELSAKSVTESNLDRAVNVARIDVEAGIGDPANLEQALQDSRDYWQEQADTAKRGSDAYVAAMARVIAIDRELTELHDKPAAQAFARDEARRAQEAAGLERLNKRKLISDLEYVNRKEQADLAAENARWKREQQELTNRKATDKEIEAARIQHETNVTAIVEGAVDDRVDIRKREADAEAALADARRDQELQGAQLLNKRKVLSDRAYIDFKEKKLLEGEDARYKREKKELEDRKALSAELEAARIKHEQNVTNIVEEATDERLELLQKELAYYAQLAGVVGGIFEKLSGGQNYVSAFAGAIEGGLNAAAAFTRGDIAGGIMGIVETIGNLGDALADLDGGMQAYRKSLLEIADIQKKALGEREVGNVFKNPWFDALSKDIEGREKLAGASFWQRLGWTLFGGAPQIMGDEAAKTMSRLSQLFQSFGEGLAGAWNTALNGAFDTGNWKKATADFSKDFQMHVGRVMLAKLAQTKLAALQIDALIQQWAEAFEKGDYDRAEAIRKDIEGRINAAFSDPEFQRQINSLPGAGNARPQPEPGGGKPVVYDNTSGGDFKVLGPGSSVEFNVQMYRDWIASTDRHSDAMGKHADAMHGHVRAVDTILLAADRFMQAAGMFVLAGQGRGGSNGTPGRFSFPKDKKRR